jgi:CO/xanthine dehydrogenase Mo-binding subunit
MASAMAADSENANPGQTTARWVGRSIPRFEDAALLTGRGRYIDDLGVRPGTLQAAILRSPHAHAEIEAIDCAAAQTADGVFAVLTAADVTALTASLVVGIKAPIDSWPIATDRVRYVGEPVAVVVASDRYRAEDALELIEVRYRPLPALVDPLAAAAPDAPLLHPRAQSNVIGERVFRYGDPEGAFAAAAHRVRVDVRYPRNSCTPIETYGVVAEYDAAEDAYDVLANFQGPFSLHPVMARALKVPGNRLRLRTPPDSGGSFGVKQAIFPYIVLIAAAARAIGRPVKWIEDRLEHLCASVSATNRVTTLEAAVEADGRITALAWDQLEDCGALLRAPEPATLYRMHGNLTGAYAIRHVKVRNRVVLTNKTPTGLNRGFGGPQMYYPLERLMQRIAIELKLDPLDVIRRNLVPVTAMPYRTATGALLDSGDFAGALADAIADGRLEALQARRAAARAEGRHYGIGFAAVVEPSVSNMGYISTALTPEERRRAGPKNGAQATATINLDPLGTVSVQVASTPQGQGHRTVLAQIVADTLGLKPQDIRVVADVDTAKDGWSIASGNYSSRFAPAVAGAAEIAAVRLRDRLARIAATQLNVPPAEIVFADGRIAARSNPDNAASFARIAAAAHWAPATIPAEVDQTIRETVFWTPPELAAPNDADESTARSATVSSSISAASKSMRPQGRCASTATSPCTIAAASCIRRWRPARSAAALRRRLAPRCTRNTRTPRTALFSPARSLTTCCRPPRRCRSRPSCIASRLRPSPRWARKAWAKAIACRRRCASPTRLPTRWGSMQSISRRRRRSLPRTFTGRNGRAPDRPSRGLRGSGEAGAIRLCARRKPRRGARCSASGGCGCPRSRRRADSGADAQHARGAAARRRRYHACAGAKQNRRRRRYDSRRRYGAPGRTRAAIKSDFAPAAPRRSASLDWPCPDTKPRHHLRLGSPCRPERGAAADIDRPRWRGGNAVATAETPHPGGCVLHRDDDDRSAR